MNGFGLDIQNALFSGGGLSAGLFDDVCHGIAFVEKTELALRGFARRRVGEDTTIDEGAVNVGYHGSDVTGAVGLPALRILLRLNVTARWFVPKFVVTLVDGVDLSARFDTDIWLGENEFSDGGI